MKTPVKTYIYLASQSKRRQDFLRQMNIPFRVVRSRYREIRKTSIRPRELVIGHAVGKARQAVLPKKRNLEAREFILGADTLVYFQRRVIGKPQTVQDARKILVEMSGKSHWVYSGIALIDCRTGREIVGCEKTKVWFKKWGLDNIEKYLKKVKPLDKAGAYAIQIQPSIVARYQGSLSNVVGLPVELLRRMLRKI
ncbi:MAG: Maf family protein [Candidatus Omnitrophica bacterium]|nr:Maf family protein [Candidatus Omnitrophota bacterium]